MKEQTTKEKQAFGFSQVQAWYRLVLAAGLIASYSLQSIDALYGYNEFARSIQHRL